MSVRLMADIFALDDMGPTQRLILLALADHADDSGRCYPSIERLCARTGLKPRSVQTNIRALVEAGYLCIEERAGPRGCNVFHVTVSPPQEMHPRIKCAPQEMPETPHITAKDPAADAPEPSKNHQETPTNAQEAQFEDFWGRCPQRKQKRKALTEWRKLTAGDRAAALEAVVAWYEHFKKEHKDATLLYPERFLKNRRWEDEGWRPKVSAHADKAAYWAESIINGSYIHRPTCDKLLCQEMLARNLITREQLEQRGLAA